MPTLGLNALMDPGQLGMGIQNAFTAGMKNARQMHRDRALEELAKNPDDPRANQVLMKADPEMAMRFRTHQRNEAEFQDERTYNAAVGEYLGGGPSADGIPQGDATGPDLSVLGEPQTPKDAAFLKMLKIDPVKAMKFKTALRDNFVDQLKADRDTMDWAVTRFAGITDEGEYQSARTEMAQRLGPQGASVLSQLPETFPGVEGLNALRLRAMDAKEQITYFQRQADIDLDNSRADRNTDSLIADRNARRNETARNNTMRNETARRGQDMRGSSSSRERIPVVRSPAEAMKLPSGTRFRTPDGQVKVRP